MEVLCSWMSGYAADAVQTHQFLQSHDHRLVCNGYYPEIHIIHPRRLEILFSLSAQIQPDWVTALCVLRPVNREGSYLSFIHYAAVKAFGWMYLLSYSQFLD